MAFTHDQALFLLRAENEEAHAVVRLNPAFQSGAFGRLEFYLNRPSKTTGQLASFGTHPNNDIQLPTRPGPSSNNQHQDGRGNRGRSFQNYRNFHFFFYLSTSGELILRDLSPCLTSIEVANASPEEGALYQLHGQYPRQRVIPRTTRMVHITFGRVTSFSLFWNPRVIEVNDPLAQENLAQQARLLAVPGVPFSAPDEETAEQPNQRRSQRELRSRYAPSLATVAFSQQPVIRKSCHRYRKLGSGTFGVVWKAVDLASGELWALKEIRADAKDDRWKESFKKEVETIWGLKHENIAHFESYQYFRMGGTFQLFFRLYSGSLEQLLPSHSCFEPPPTAPVWAPRLIAQMLDALDYLHEQGVIHRDIKPGNVLYDYAQGDRQPSFYLADFGLSVTAQDAQGTHPAGTLTYMAPEVVLEGKSCPASDVWSFAIMLGRVLGLWCEAERYMEASAWSGRFAALGAGDGIYAEPAQFAAPHHEQRRWYYRITSLAESGLLPSMFARMLVAEPHRASPAYCKNAATDDFIKRPKRPRRLTSEEAQADGGVVWRLSGRHVDDMSIEVRRQLY